jgi:membrane protein
MKALAEVWALVKEAFTSWQDDKAASMGAALAYYSLFSLSPLLIIAIAIASLVFGQEAAQGQIVEQLTDTVGQPAAGALQEIIGRTHASGSGWWATIIGLVTLLFGASAVFSQLQEALNTVWKVTPRPGRAFLTVVRERFLSFTMVLGTGFLLLISLVITAALASLGSILPIHVPGGAWLWQLVNTLVSLAFITVLFALIYKELPDVKLAWTDVWIGAAVTALLFTLGRYLLGLYLASSSVASAYGAAGSLVLVLVWVYYSSQLLLFGAELTRVYAKRKGRQVLPADYALLVIRETRTAEATHGQPLAAAGSTAR